MFPLPHGSPIIRPQEECVSIAVRRRVVVPGVRRSAAVAALLLAIPPSAAAQTAASEPLPELLPVAEETRLALDAAPAHLRAGAGVYVLRERGFVRVRESSNGFTCLVNRDHPRALKPTCWDAEGTRTIVPRVLYEGELLMRGVSPSAIAREVADGFRTGRFAPPTRPGVAYMLSSGIRNVDHATGAERTFPPHVMFYAPGLTDADIGTGETVAEGMPFIDYQGPHGYMIVMPRRTARGSVSRELLRVPAGRDAATELPIVTVRGARPGPTVAVVAGLHGTEYASILAVQRLARELNPDSLAGTVLLVPLANVAAFERTTVRLNPVDGMNMNRAFPGDSAGTQSQRVAYHLRTRVLEKSDFVIDLHGGDLDESLRRYLFAVLTGDAAQDSVTRRMALSVGYDHLIEYRLPSRDPKAATMLAAAAAVLGKPTITVEAGEAGTSRAEDIAALADGVLRVLGGLGIAAVEPPPASTPVWFAGTSFVTSDRTGVFHAAVERGAWVGAGTLLGHVTDYFGDGRHEIRSPAAGVVLYVRSVPSVVEGGQVAFIGQVK